MKITSCTAVMQFFMTHFHNNMFLSSVYTYMQCPISLPHMINDPASFANKKESDNTCT